MAHANWRVGDGVAVLADKPGQTQRKAARAAENAPEGPPLAKPIAAEVAQLLDRCAATGEVQQEWAYHVGTLWPENQAPGVLKLSASGRTLTCALCKGVPVDTAHLCSIHHLRKLATQHGRFLSAEELSARNLVSAQRRLLAAEDENRKSWAAWEKKNQENAARGAAGH